MTVIAEHPAQAHAILRSIHAKDVLEAIEHEYRERSKRLVQPVRDAGLAAESVVVHGSAFIGAIRAALQRT